MTDLATQGALRIAWREHLVNDHDGWSRLEADRWNVNTLANDHAIRYPDCDWVPPKSSRATRGTALTKEER